LFSINPEKRRQRKEFKTEMALVAIESEYESGTAAQPRAAVEVESLSKSFLRSRKRPWPWARTGGRSWSPAALARGVEDRKVALEDVSLSVAESGITGILGPNGSGKSTLVRILSTLLTPDAGSARVFGHDVVAEAMEVRRHINRVSVEAAFFKEMSPWENLAYAARLYGAGGAGTREQAEAILRRMSLPKDVLDKPMKQLSRGQQQKVAIARTFLTSPSLLLMDEPTTGLDPRSKREVQALIATIREQRDATVLLCTHDLQEAEALCDRVLVMDRGRILADGTVEELKRDHGGEAGTLEEAFMRLTGRSLEDDREEDEEEGENENANDTEKGGEQP
jgi:ABC-2 type transport system ATP-binding protein